MRAVCSRRRCLSTLAVGGLSLCNGASTIRADFGSRPHVTTVIFSPDAESILIGSQAGVEVCDAERFSKTRSIDVDMDSIHDLQFSPDGRWLAVAGGSPGESGAVAWVRWSDGTLVRRDEIHDDVVHQIAFSADGSKWATAASDEVCSVFRIDESQPICRFTKHSRAVLGVTFLPDGETLVSGSRDETLRVWNASSGEPIRTLHNHSREVTAIALKPNSTSSPMVASASADLTVRFWQPTIGRMVRFARLPSTPLAIDWVQSGRLLAAACEDGQVRWIDPVRVLVVESARVGDDWLYCIAEDPKQPERVVVGGAFGTLQSRRLNGAASLR
jgi:WD40 repeat protein